MGSSRSARCCRSRLQPIQSQPPHARNSAVETTRIAIKIHSGSPVPRHTRRFRGVLEAERETPEEADERRNVVVHHTDGGRGCG